MPTLPSLPPSSYTAFAVSFVVTVLLVLTKRWHGRFSMDGVKGVQKQHTTPTPRIGGLAIVLGVLAAWAVARPERRQILGPILVAGLPAFLFGLAEDLTKKVTVLARLMATIFSGVLGWWLTGMALTSLDIVGIDLLMGVTVVSVAFTAFAVGGVANAINIIDGFNGLASGFVVLALTGVAAMALSLHDINLALASLSVAGAMLGFWLVNWPWGKIFLGDGGSYFGGFALAWACVMLVERNYVITPFAPLLVCIHPVTEVLFTIYRRRLRHCAPGQPDRLHLHSLIMRRVVRPALRRVLSDPIEARILENSWTGIVLALMTVPAVISAWLVRLQPLPAAGLCLLFMLGYVTLYARLVRFRWCSPLHFMFIKPVQRLRSVG